MLYDEFSLIMIMIVIMMMIIIITIIIIIRYLFVLLFLKTHKNKLVHPNNEPLLMQKKKGLIFCFGN